MTVKVFSHDKEPTDVARWQVNLTEATTPSYSWRFSS